VLLREDRDQKKSSPVRADRGVGGWAPPRSCMPGVNLLQHLRRATHAIGLRPGWPRRASCRASRLGPTAAASPPFACQGPREPPCRCGARHSARLHHDENHTHGKTPSRRAHEGRRPHPVLHTSLTTPSSFTRRLPTRASVRPNQNACSSRPHSGGSSVRRCRGRGFRALSCRSVTRPPIPSFSTLTFLLPSSSTCRSLFLILNQKATSVFPHIQLA